MGAAAQFGSFSDFYPYYLREHQNRTNRRLHFFGTSLALVLLAVNLATANWLLLVAVPLAGYGPAWVGHFYFERNRPATFYYPFYSLIGDFRMYADIWAGRIPF